MSDRLGLPTEILEDRLIAVIRGTDVSRLTQVVKALMDGGVRCIEITMTVPDAITVLRGVSTMFGDHACVGAGTVLTGDQARASVDAGARFVLAPSLVPEVVAAVGGVVPVVPGALTPTEVVAAWESGAAAVKLFPASLGGTRYLRELRAPLPDVPFVPTGGIEISDVPAYLDAGAVAVGLGGALIADAFRGGSLDAVRERARAAIDAARGGRRASTSRASAAHG